MSLEVSFLLERPQADLAGMLGNVAVNQHVHLQLRLLAELLAADVALEEAALRRQEVRSAVLLHVLQSLEGSVTQVADDGLVRLVSFSVRVQAFAGVKALKVFLLVNSAWKDSQAVEPSNKRRRRTTKSSRGASRNGTSAPRC